MRPFPIQPRCRHAHDASRAEDGRRCSLQIKERREMEKTNSMTRLRLAQFGFGHERWLPIEPLDDDVLVAEKGAAPPGPGFDLSAPTEAERLPRLSPPKV